MTITAEQVKQLRDQTGAGMMECKKALSEASGDVDKAVELYKAGMAQAEKRSPARARSRRRLHPRREPWVPIEVNCETDFVARR
jgi:elongation factor Ts